MSWFSYLLFISFVFYGSYGQRENKFFRKDYHYLESVESFYKIQTIPRSWQVAKQICEWEGATLFYPENEVEANAVLGYVKEAQGYNHFWIGISSLLAKGVFETIDGLSLLDVYNKWATGEPNDGGGEEDCVVLNKEGSMNDDGCWKKHPYICKKTLAFLEWNTACKMPYPDYKYNKELGRCYKFHLSPKNWTEAYTICSSELSFLAVIESQAEADFLQQLTSLAPKDNIPGNYLRGAVHLGYHNRNGNGWRTIKGTPLENSGYSRWGGGQPDGGDLERCGTMFYNGQLNDIACDRRCFFICENDDVDVNNFDDRFADIS
ncbi:macrophage mannose receptor 1 [Plodia interpunctella]|uniref:macrophage mannose receptor 1 n=1 Tax=Plodia interpunctella TaxID=58824 RepID=UPI0023686BD9|nr:macrophage mannose receptor 1 [Plodia interpunctella]